MAQGLSCSVVCGIFLNQGSNLCLLHWQADSLPLGHLGNAPYKFLNQLTDINKIPSKILTGIVLNLYISLRRTNIFAMLNLLIHKHGLSLRLLTQM